jgi:hypothetical protein
MSNKTKVLLGVVGILLIFSSLFVGCEVIDAGSVGIKVDRIGGERGATKTQYVNGFQFYLRGVSQIHEYPISQQPTEYKNSEDKPEDFVIAAKGGTPFIMHPSFSFAVNANTVDTMFQKLRLPLEQLKEGYIKNALRIALREVTNTFTPDSILNYVAAYDAAVMNEMNHRLAPYFVVSQYTSNTIPDDNIRAAVKAKALAIQNAQTIENRQKEIRAQVENDILEAKRDSAVTVMEALAEAKSISVKQEALRQSPQYVELIKAEKWDGKLPSYMFGSGTIPMINLNKNN